MNTILKLTQLTIASTLLIINCACGGGKKQAENTSVIADSVAFKTTDGEDIHYPVEVELAVEKPTPYSTKELSANFNEQNPELTKVQSRLADQLLALNNSSIDVISTKAEKVLKTILPTVTKEQADSLVDIYRSYHNLHLEQLSQDPYYTQVSEGFYTSFDDLNVLPSAYQPIAAEAKKNGFCLVDWGEGMCGFERCPDYLLSLFSAYITDAMKEYLTIEAYENAHPFLFDAAICITNVELGDRIITFENYLKKYPDALKSKDMAEYQTSYYHWLFYGCDNTPTFDYNEEGERSKLNTEVYQEYQTIIQNHPNSDLGKLLRDYCKLLSKSKLRITPAVEAFLDENVGSGSDYDG